MARLVALVTLILTLAAPVEAEGPQRIVSLYPGHSENIVALGAGDRLVALSRSDDDGLLPDLPRLSPKVGGEALLALAPDLVVARSLVLRLNPALEPTLSEAGITLLCLDPPLWKDFDAYLRTLATALAVDADEAVGRAASLRRALADEAESRRGGRPRPRVFIEATEKGLQTCAPHSWAARLVALVGGENVAATEKKEEETKPLMAWGIERFLKEARLGLDIYLVQQGTMNGATVDDVRRRPWMEPFDGVKVVAVEEGLLSRPSLLGLERGGRELIDIFYPREESLP